MNQQVKMPERSPDERYRDFVEMIGNREESYGVHVANFFVDGAVTHLERLPSDIKESIKNNPIALATFLGSYVKASAGSGAALVSVVEDIGIALRDYVAEALFKMTRTEEPESVD